jgi:hypothetical protein
MIRKLDVRLGEEKRNQRSAKAEALEEYSLEKKRGRRVPLKARLPL